MCNPDCFPHNYTALAFVCKILNIIISFRLHSFSASLPVFRDYFENSCSFLLSHLTFKAHEVHYLPWCGIQYWSIGETKFSDAQYLWIAGMLWYNSPRALWSLDYLRAWMWQKQQLFMMFSVLRFHFHLSAETPCAVLSWTQLDIPGEQARRENEAFHALG